MVTETVGDTKALEESGFLDMIGPELVDADGGVPGQPRL